MKVKNYANIQGLMDRLDSVERLLKQLNDNWGQVYMKENSVPENEFYLRISTQQKGTNTTIERLAIEFVKHLIAHYEEMKKQIIEELETL